MKILVVEGPGRNSWMRQMLKDAGRHLKAQDVIEFGTTTVMFRQPKANIQGLEFDKIIFDEHAKVGSAEYAQIITQERP